MQYNLNHDCDVCGEYCHILYDDLMPIVISPYADGLKVSGLCKKCYHKMSKEEIVEWYDFLTNSEIYLNNPQLILDDTVYDELVKLDEIESLKFQEFLRQRRK